MESNLVFDFTVDNANKIIVVKREFAANIELVWEAWSNPKIIDQWWAPKPHHSETKSMDFREGGFRHWALVSPEGSKHWSRQDYQKIEPQKSIAELRAFCYENGIVSADFIKTQCTTTFSKTNGNTLVTITSIYGNPKVFEQMASLNHKKGFSSTLENLDQVLNDLKTLKP